MSSAPNPAPVNPSAGADPSMEDILASIRRILSEDEAQPHPASGGPPHPPTDVLALDASMMVEEDEPARADPVPASPLPAPDILARQDPDATVSPIVRAAMIPPPADRLPPAAPAPRPAPAGVPPLSATAGDTLVAPEAAAAAASSVGSLLTKLAEQRAMPVYRNGPTLEDIVREEIRPMLKEWLDTHIPTIVERLVRAEIERVVNSAMR